MRPHCAANLTFHTYCATLCRMEDTMHKHTPNDYTVSGEVAQLHLKGGYTVLVDTADLPLVLQHRWYVHRSGTYGYKHVMTVRRTDGVKTVLYLHRFLLNTPAHLHVDHINHDPLDNRRANLRNVRPVDNQLNVKKTARTGSQTGVPNVYIYTAAHGRRYYRVSVKRRGERRAAEFPYTAEGLCAAIEARDRFIAELAALHPITPVSLPL